MGDEGDFWKAEREARRLRRMKNAVPCPDCVVKLPKANASLLLPGQRCRIHGYRDPRTRLPDSCPEWNY